MTPSEEKMLLMLSKEQVIELMKRREKGWKISRVLNSFFDALMGTIATAWCWMAFGPPAIIAGPALVALTTYVMNRTLGQFFDWYTERTINKAVKEDKTDKTEE